MHCRSSRQQVMFGVKCHQNTNKGHQQTNRQLPINRMMDQQTIITKMVRICMDRLQKSNTESSIWMSSVLKLQQIYCFSIKFIAFEYWTKFSLSLHPSPFHSFCFEFQLELNVFISLFAIDINLLLNFVFQFILVQKRVWLVLLKLDISKGIH